MQRSSRRTFLQSSSVLLAGAFIGTSFISKNKKPLLSFSTLGCPDWDFATIMAFAVQHGYDGIELRGIQRELELTKCKEFETPSARKQTLQLMKDAGLQFVDLGSSCTLHFGEGAERTKNLDEGRRFIDLANDIECAYVRVFPNLFPKDQSKETTMELMSKGLLELAAHAEGTNVKVLLETHGDLVYATDVEKVMKESAHQHVGLIWDICNMWTVTKEDIADVYRILKPYIFHAHIKDASLIEGKWSYVFLGKGGVPVMKAIDLLRHSHYKGYYSFEWEKLWYPEIAAPEMALPDYVKTMKEHFKR